MTSRFPLATAQPATKSPAEEIAQLHQTKTYVSLFKANYKTKPDLALAAFKVIGQYLAAGMVWSVQDPRYYSPSNFLYRDQVIKLGLARTDLSLSAELIYAHQTNNNQVDFQYELWQTALTNPSFHDGLLKYFSQYGQDNFVHKALTVARSVNNPADLPYHQLLNGQLPAEFSTRADLINFALVMHLDRVWTIPGLTLSPSNQISFKDIAKLNHRLASTSNWSIVPQLISLGFFHVTVWLAWLLLTQGRTAYINMLKNPLLTSQKYQVSQVMNEMVTLVQQNGSKLELARWQELIETLLAGGTVDQLFEEVKLAAKAILAMVYPQLKVQLGRALLLQDGWTATDDLTTIMADFVLSSDDLIRAGTNNGKVPDAASWAILLPWYQGNSEILQIFINQSLRNPFKDQYGTLQISPFLYLAALAAGLPEPQHNYRVVPLLLSNGPVVAFWLRKFWPLKIPSIVINSGTIAALNQELLVHQSIVEQYY